jgi:hypothetical protein
MNTRTDDRRVITARYSGRCVVCDGYTAPGATLIELSGKWAHIECDRKEKLALELIRELSQRMVQEHGIALGVFGIPPGCKPTFTRREWLRETMKRLLLSDDDVALLDWHWRGIIDRDLSD